MEVTSIDAVEYGQTTTLECTALAGRGITSGIDIIWTYGGLNSAIVRRVDNVTANIVNNSAVYIDQFTTPPLSVNDSGRIYYCFVSINATYSNGSYDTIKLDFTGE